MQKTPGAKRKTHEGYRLQRIARDLIGPFRERVAELQLKTARLRAMDQLARERDQVRDEALQLAPLAIALRIEFEAAAAEVDELVARHSVVADVRRALVMLREQLDHLAA